MKEPKVESLPGQPCPICHTKNLTLTQAEDEIPFFGKIFIFGMSCSNCGFRKSDVEAAEMKEPAKYELEVNSEEDMNIRIIRSSEGKIRIPYIIDIEPGENAEGFVTNVEGLIDKVRGIIQHSLDIEEDEETKDKARKLLKKLMRAKFGQEKIKIIIEDPSGNSAIISEKAVKTKLKR